MPSSSSLPGNVRSVERLGVYMFYDPDGIVDRYVAVALDAFRAHVNRLIVICNGAPDAAGRASLEVHADEVIVRANSGFDVGAYQAAIEATGREALAGYDELLLLNYTFYAPIFPLGDMFTAMQARDCDFWGITAHKEMRPNPLTGGEVLPFHLQSHFLAIRSPMLQSDAFWRYWSDMPVIGSYIDSITLHETRFTEHFRALGYRSAVYLEPEDFDTEHPLFLEIDRMIQARCPILKRRQVFHDPIYLEGEAVDLRRAFDRISRESAYPTELIIENALRTTALRTLYTNLEWLDVLPEVAPANQHMLASVGRIGVLAHVYYDDMIDELRRYAENIPCPFDLCITTDTGAKRDRLRAALAGFERGELRIDVVPSNLGRDTAALLIVQRDLVLSGRYDLLCRIHSKKSPQDGRNRADSFKYHLLENLLGSPGYVANLLTIFAGDPSVGVIMPPTVHVGYPTLGHAWFLNKPRVEELALKLKISVPMDVHTPVATYGSMFWFRPAALRPLFEYPWQWDDFDEAVYGDRDLPHAIERLITYCAQSRGFATRCVYTARQAAKNYVKLEYKLQLLASCFRTGDIRAQVLHMIYGAPEPPRPPVADAASPPRLRVALSGVAYALRRSVAYRVGRLRSWLHMDTSTPTEQRSAE